MVYVLVFLEKKPTKNKRWCFKKLFGIISDLLPMCYIFISMILHANPQRPTYATLFVPHPVLHKGPRCICSAIGSVIIHLNLTS